VPALLRVKLHQKREKSTGVLVTSARRPGNYTRQRAY
jgi:hypothetical protein